jgi:hypothetical protein
MFPDAVFNMMFPSTKTSTSLKQSVPFGLFIRSVISFFFYLMHATCLDIIFGKEYSRVTNSHVQVCITDSSMNFVTSVML